MITINRSTTLERLDILRPRSKPLERDRRTDRSKETEGASSSIGTREFEHKDERLEKSARKKTEE